MQMQIVQTKDNDFDIVTDKGDFIGIGFDNITHCMSILEGKNYKGTVQIIARQYKFKYRMT